MVSPVPSGGVQQAYQQPLQQTFSAGNEAKAKTEDVQPRNAPASDSQKSSSKQADERRAERRQEQEDDINAKQAAAANDSRARGSRLDVTV